MKAKLYSTRSAWLTRYNALIAHFELDGDERWSAEMKVGDDGDDDGKWILPLPTDGSFKADHLVTGPLVDYNYDWHEAPPVE